MPRISASGACKFESRERPHSKAVGLLFVRPYRLSRSNLGGPTADLKAQGATPVGHAPMTPVTLVTLDALDALDALACIAAAVVSDCSRCKRLHVRLNEGWVVGASVSRLVGACRSASRIHQPPALAHTLTTIT